MSAAGSFRDEVRTFLAQQLPEGWQGVGGLDPEEHAAFVKRWRETLHANRLLAVTWPARYGGRGLTAAEHVALYEELAQAGVPAGAPTDNQGIQMLGNTLLQCGSPGQCEQFLPRILSGADRWAQGYSEPAAGSDLAAVRCRAHLDGQTWRIDGQKTWTSYATQANWIFVLARTGSDSDRHRGLTFLLVPLDQPGIEVRPIRQMSGKSTFCDVFFDDARTPSDNVVGDPGAGWHVAMTLLGFERGDTAVVTAIRLRQELQRLYELARSFCRLGDARVRDRLAWCHTRVEILRIQGQEALQQRLAGHTPGSDAAMFKLAWSEYHQAVTELAVEIMGPEAMVPAGRHARLVDGPDEPGTPNTTAGWVDMFLTARSATIYAGSSEIQRNIIAERILGLPRDPIRPAAATHA